MFEPSDDSSESMPKSGSIELNEDFEYLKLINKSFDFQSFINLDESKIDNDQFTHKNISELDQIDKPKLSEKPCDDEKLGSTTLSPPKNLEAHKNLKNKKFMGRKRKNQGTIETIKTDNSKAHDRNSEDNKMRKLKTNIMEKEIFNKLNESLNDKTLKFYRLHSDINQNLSKKFNEDLMKTKNKKLFSNVSISEKYRTEIDPLSNQKLVKKIVKERKEKKTLKILNMTYYQVIQKIRKEKMNAFLENIKNKEIKMKNIDNIDEYMDSLKNLLINFKKWFKEKKSRKREKKKKSKKKPFYINEAA